MRKVLLAVTILLAASLQAARADANQNAAPADEYFGPYKQSVLEIRNRLDDYDKYDNGAMMDPTVAQYLDHLQIAIKDWQRKYPGDPWLPRTFAHLMREYWRAGQASSEGGMAAIAYMRAAYPNAPETSETVAMIYGSNGDAANVAYNQPPVEEAPPPEEPPAIEEAPPAVEEAPPPAEEAPPAEQPPAEDAAPAQEGAPSYDAARGYDPVHGYDAARGYDASRGYSAGQEEAYTPAPRSNARPAYHTQTTYSTRTTYNQTTYNGAPSGGLPSYAIPGSQAPPQ
jgi:outer membrane biosynthesis protein TonB